MFAWISTYVESLLACHVCGETYVCECCANHFWDEEHHWGALKLRRRRNKASLMVV